MMRERRIMSNWLDWGGIRGRGFTIKNDLVMGLLAITMATAVLILAYALYERNAVKTFCEIHIESAIARVDQAVLDINRVWDSDFISMTLDSLNPDVDPDALRSSAISINTQIRKDANELHTLRIDFANLPANPQPCEPCVEKTGGYIRTADNYATIMRETTQYLHDVAIIESNMNEAARDVQIGGGNVTPEALAHRDAILLGELEKIKKLVPPPMMKDFHRDTVSFLSDYVNIATQTTAAYIAGSDSVKLDQLGREGELVLRNGRNRLRNDILAAKSLMQGGQAKLKRDYRQSAWEELHNMMSKYRF